jgi:hypothetical protein
MKKLFVLILVLLTSCGKPATKTNLEYNQNNCKEPIELNKQSFY